MFEVRPICNILSYHDISITCFTYLKYVWACGGAIFVLNKTLLCDSEWSQAKLISICENKNKNKNAFT